VRSIRRTLRITCRTVVVAVVFGAAPVAAAPADAPLLPAATAPGLAGPAAAVPTASPAKSPLPRSTAAATVTATKTPTPDTPSPDAASTGTASSTGTAPMAARATALAPAIRLAEEPETADPPVAPLHDPTVVLYGDSLAWEARGAFALALADRPGVRVSERTFGGTAICDWLTAMADDAATLGPGAVVVEFSGNNFTPCMHDDTGRPLTGDALVERYAADAAAVVATFAPHGTQVIFAGAPTARGDSDSGGSIISRLNERYALLARSSDDVRYVDAGASVLVDGSWTATLPCLEWEPCGADGTNVVRSPDGLHFCPASGDADRGVTGDCPVWSSGAFRFGAALAAPVIEHLDAA